ncbi:MAG: Flp family type IVb pilin [Hyphomicrobium sp.]|nr:Flp family type IVb pilin [Hyphomicrobium sp.]
MSKIAHFMNDESGATAIEYGLIAAILSVGIITILGTVKTNLNGTFSKIATELSTANGAN